MWRLTVLIFQSSRHSTLQVTFILRLHPEPSDGLTDFTLLSESSEKCGKGEIRTLTGYGSAAVHPTTSASCVYQFRHFAQNCPSFRAVIVSNLYSISEVKQPHLTLIIRSTTFRVPANSLLILQWY